MKAEKPGQTLVQIQTNIDRSRMVEVAGGSRLLRLGGREKGYG
jgi:hypothetical protein